MLLSAHTFRCEELARRGVAFAVLPRVDVLPHAVQLACDIADKPRAALVTLKAHQVRDIRQQLPAVIEREVLMHETTFCQSEVRQRIENKFGR